ncbi:hypothetical protein B0H34DRAFT_689999 [Crassisporium funariophilum]|nr:hypothetical protein B0H34DRAFT_689999 [Crassisporium funariophilum]
MPGVVDGKGPSYISAHSADVILSDIRPIKLKAEALRAINVLLDEFLYKILSASSSLATDKLRASLLSLLPTSLGKEALLEAEVELRAYWERTESKSPLEDDSRTFHLQWAFELLRLKCEAYSTLNEEDEDPALESRVNERLGQAHPHPPKVALVDPAALYLTAILESMCEHILSNVGRVAARDSSRTNATVNDLFVALCEDDSIYGLFKIMKVYEQIDLMSKSPKTRRSKSFSRNDRLSISRTSSPHHDLTLVNSSSGSRSRQSSDGQSVTANPTANSGSRASFEKTRAIRMFTNSKGSVDRDGESQLGHKKSESVRSESSRHLQGDDIADFVEDAEMLREFDDLMRSTATMKVSLTPDRLKTMEVYKQEKDQRNNNTSRRPPTHSSSLSEPDFPSASRVNSQRPLPRPVDSIVEDDEEAPSPKGRIRQASVATPPSSTFAGIAPGRTRSVSTSGAGIHSAPRQPTRAPSLQAAPSSFSHAIPTGDMVQSRDLRNRKVPDNNGFPARTRNIQRNRDSLDLDDVMNGSDDDDQTSISGHQTQFNSPSAPKRHGKPVPHAVSKNTRELMDFLAEGPPEPVVSKDGKELMDFLAQGPPDYAVSAISLESSKPKGAGRLQRMISKLNLGKEEKGKAPSDVSKAPSMKQPTTPVRSNMHNMQPGATLSSLANRPIPPRPRPISPPSSPSQDSSDENKSFRSPPRKPYHDTISSREGSSVEKPYEKPSPAIPMPVATAYTANRDIQEKSTSRMPAHANGNGFVHPKNGLSPKENSFDIQPVVPVRTTSYPIPVRKPVPVVTSTPTTPNLSETDAKDMQRLFSSATTADECRLIFDMFMARSGISKESRTDVPYPSPSPSIVKPTRLAGGGAASVETSVVELLLGGSTTVESPELPPLRDPAVLESLPVLAEEPKAIPSRPPRIAPVGPMVRRLPVPQA